MPLYAHSTDTGEDFQLLSEHLANVASIAGAFAGDFGAREWAQAAGILHDWGKASREFQRRLCGDPRRADHSTAGAQFAAKTWPTAGKLLAACIAGHHGGLADGVSDKDSCLKSRLRRDDLPRLIREDELPQPEKVGKMPIKPEVPRLAFQVSFFTRMLFSCLVDADFLDTEQFLDREKSTARQGYPPLCKLESSLKLELDSILRKAASTPINLQRREILEACLARSEDPPGIFSLTVPTGGGKTLSSLAFALRHALHHGIKRIIYVIPFTSIIEQNADVFRRILGNNAVLEHHSAFDAGRLGHDNSENDENLRRFELSAENWDAPLIVTTSVQFYESLFSSRPSRCRKLHNIAKSVVILDEAQMLPVEFLLPCLEALKELASNYGSSIVLCTATQPALSKNEEFKKGLEDVREIVPNPKGLYTALRRVEIEKAGVLAQEELARKLLKHEQVLCIVNTRREAREVFEGLGSVDGAYHLSALMCPEHRSQKLTEIKERLEQKLSCRVVSTRLIEAGVDVDFPIVYRTIAGIDSIAQAAGRCNREGKLPYPGRVFLFDFENGALPGPFRAPAEVAAEIMRKYPDDPLSLEAVEDFFRLLYWRAGDRLDTERILNELEEGLRDCFFPFQRVAERFRIIKDEGETVLIPFNDIARNVIADLQHAKFPGTLLRKGQRYGVQVHRWEMSALEAAGAVERVQGNYPALTQQGYELVYKSDVGLIVPKGPMSVELLVQ